MTFKTPLKRTAAAAIFLISNAVMAECGSIEIAEMNWASAELMANVDKLILQEGYGCEVTLVPGATETTFASMRTKAQPDIASEQWTNSIREPLEKAILAGKLYSINPSPITDLGEGWWLPPHTQQAHPELKTVLDVIAHPELFPDKEDPSKGAFITCPAGWGCQVVNANLFRGFGMAEKGWKLVDSGSGAGLDGSMTKAVERGENWFGYYWSPTAMIGKYKMVKLDFGVPYIGDEHWNKCITAEDCANPKPSAWTKSEVHTIITDKLKKRGDEAVLDYLNKRVFPGKVMNKMLVYMNENQAEGEDAAIEFLLTNHPIWTPWVTRAAARKIKRALR